LNFAASHAILDGAKNVIHTVHEQRVGKTIVLQVIERGHKKPMKILVIHGPNLNLLGKRDPTKYGTVTMNDINKNLQILANEVDCALEFFQSNHEGAIIDFLQRESSRAADGVIINPGALVRYGYSLRQAFIDLGKPTIEVHMSDIHKTGVNTAVNVLEGIRIDQIVGLKERSYYEALKKLIKYLRVD